MKEELIYIARRKKLVEELLQKGIKDPVVLNAINAVPRQFFMNSSLIDFSYVDKAYPIAAGQTISQPFTVATQTQLLEVKPDEKVLEIGTGSGYQAAVLACCGVKLFSIERQKELYDKTHRLLKQLGYNSVTCKFGDGFEGWPQEAPFDKIIITAGASEIPKVLLRQLKIGGFMVIPYGTNNKLEMYRIERVSESDFTSRNFGNCAFVPMLKGTNDAK